MSSTLYPLLDDFARLLPFDKRRQAPDVVIVESFNLYLLDLTDDRSRYRLAHTFAYEGRVFRTYVRGDGAGS